MKHVPGNKKKSRSILEQCACVCGWVGGEVRKCLKMWLHYAWIVPYKAIFNMKTLLSLAIWIVIFCEPLHTNGSPLQSDIKGQSSDHSHLSPATLKTIESLLGIQWCA